MTWRWASVLLVLLALGCEGATVSLATRTRDAGGARDGSARQDASDDEDQDDDNDDNDENDEDEGECEPLLGQDCTERR